MTEQMFEKIKKMSNEDLVRTYKQFAIKNDRESNYFGVNAELQAEMFKEIMRRMK